MTTLTISGTCGLVGLALATALPSPAAAADRVESGAQLYVEYCARCHGADGAGEGELVEFREAGLPDLRTLALRHGGFPLERVMATIDGRAELDAHGERFMPAWGEIFRFDEDRGDALAHARILNLIVYLQRIQKE